tara:strand:+ start:2317 stop:2853 length:537 start_codon:yes stop_codon:yes gene_type:complete
MRSITKRKEHFDNFAWKILDILRKSKEKEELNKEERSLYNNWLESIEDYGIILIPQNRIIELNTDKADIYVYSFGIFNEEKLIAGVELVLNKEKKKDLKARNINYFYAETKIKKILSDSFIKLEEHLKENKELQNEIARKPFLYATLLVESDKEFLNVNKLNEETGRNIKDYLSKKSI